MARVYKLTDGERAIIEKAQRTGNPNWFTDWFLRSDTSGTYFYPNAQTGLWRERYEKLHDAWKTGGQPNKLDHGGKEYVVQWDSEWTDPVFFLNHGFLFQPWQLEAQKAKQRWIVVIGGFGSGKTLFSVCDALYLAATVPNFRALFLAPSSKQAEEAFQMAVTMMQGTPYEKFILRQTVKAPQTLVMGNDLVGPNSRLECYPIGDAVGVAKIKTFTLDKAYIDQAEELDNIPEITRVIGTRFRGQVHGRRRIGQGIFTANAQENEGLWNLYDEATENPKRVLALNPTTYDNIYITDKQLAEFEHDVGGDEESIRVHMKGGRPRGLGKKFPPEILKNIESPALDDAMEKGLKAKLPGYVMEVWPKIGCTKWELPYNEGDHYLVVADPGTDNPPNRNAAAILVWNITHFPKQPAHLAAYSWVFGNHRPEPWIAQYDEYITRYHAKMTNAIDSTGWQGGYVESMWAFNQINATGVSLVVQNKSRYLTFARQFCERSLFKIPTKVEPIFNQLSRYEIPDDKLVQDIVTAVMISAAQLEPLLYLQDQKQKQQAEEQFLPRAEPRYGDFENRWAPSVEVMESRW